MALTFIAGSVATAIIENLVSTCLSYLKAYPAALRGMRDELERLQLALPQIRTVLTAVEEATSIAERNEALDAWLWQLRDAVENAEDVLDELDYYELKKTVRDRDDKVRGILSKCKKTFDRFINRKFGDDTLKRLREAVKGLDRVIAGMGPLVQLVTGIYGPRVKRQKLEEIKNARETSSLLTESEAVGRDKERDLIVEWLIKPEDADVNVSAFTIVGMGGLGKTTLAQLIYRNEKVQKYFDPMMWVCVSQDFDAAEITKKMLEGPSSAGFGDKSLNALHEILGQKLTSKRFLLILDDVWNDDKMMEWEKLVAPLKLGQRGSKILLTTRMSSVAEMAARVMQCKRESINLNGLEESDYMSLFSKHAFLGVNPDDYKNLQPIGKQIVKKLGGCPLAIKVIGGLLNSCMDYDHWNRILKEDTMKLQQEKDGIMAVLRLSYDHLPTNLQLCFRYCCIFPQDYKFKRKELVYMWMGSGLIPQSICGRQRPEDIGKEYLNLLTRKSLFTCQSKDFFGRIYRRYIMHDLLHDLAQSVSLGECARIGVDITRNTIPGTIRHLSIEIINLLSIRGISNLKNLRTLVVSVKIYQMLNADHILAFNEVIRGFKNLRLLSLRLNFGFRILLDALDSLIHLRYLYLSPGNVVNKSFMDFFPQSLYRLYHLEVMKFSTTEEITSDNTVYDGLSKLVNLRSLDVPDGMKKNIRFVSKLPFIHKLENFSVREESGYKISELKNLRDLSHLCIRGLENVRSSEEAMEAKLNEKEYLKSLSLRWSEGRSSCVEVDELLLNELRPHINLKKLCIEQYRGMKSPCWMTDISLINLTSIKLMHCKGWEHLPPLGQFSSLSYLHLYGLHAIKQISSSFFGTGDVCAFPSLKKLFFEDMPNLEKWNGIDHKCMFPQLHSMEIIGCPNLRGIPTLSRSLRRLKIFKVGLTALPAINQDCKNNNQEHFQAFESLVIKQCEKLEYVPPEFFGKFNTFEVLCIENCPKLTKCGISDIQLPSVSDELTIGPCGDLEVPLLWSANLTSLTTLYLTDCASITSLPPAQVCARWTMLSHLEIKNCKELSSFGGIQALVSLRCLEINGCDKLIEAALRQPPFPNSVSKRNATDCFLKLDELSIDHDALLLMEPLRSLSSIKWLTLSEDAQLTSLPEEWLLQNHSALWVLSIENACSLQSLPQSMTKLCSLECLQVYDANLIQSLPDLPTSLRRLYINGCHPVLKERCQEHAGLDWPKIANIPNVTIYPR